MPAHGRIRPVPNAADLPFAVLRLTFSVLKSPWASPDTLLILADAVDELANDRSYPCPSASALHALAADLRDRAPEYA